MVNMTLFKEATVVYWCATVAAATVLTYLAKIIYNLYFHPLAHVPGPFLARASAIPSWLKAMGGKRHIWLWQQLQVYGSPFRPEPNVVVFCDPEAYHQIYNNRANVRRSNFYEVFVFKDDQKSTLSTIDVTEHSKRRKFLNICFTERMTREACKFVTRHIDQWNEILVRDVKAGDWSATLELSRSIDGLVFDIMGDLNFGTPTNIKEPGDQPYKEIPRMIKQVVQHNYGLGRSPFRNIFLWLKARGLETLMEKMAPLHLIKYMDFVYDSVDQQIARQEAKAGQDDKDQRQDIFHFLYNAVDPETGVRGLDKTALRAEAGLLVAAGSDTTSITLSAIFFYLTGDPRRLKKLENEILSTFESIDDVSHGPVLKGCTYLRACVDEAMRMAVAGPSELPREVLPGGINIKGKHYPAGTIVGTSPWCDSRNQEVYGDPDVFRPERWIVDEANGVTQDDVARAKTNFNPFSAGPGHCVGKVFAISEILVAVARTIYRLEVRRAPGSTVGGGHPSLGWAERNPSVMQIRDAFITLRDGPEVQFRKRDSHT